MFKKYYVFIFSIIFIFIILGFNFFVNNGTYFLLDGVFFPVYELKGFFDLSLFGHLNSILSILLGYSLYSKMFMFLLLFFTAILGFSISKLLIKYSEIKHSYTEVLSSIGVLFFLLNPFFYERTITQPGISLGILFIGFGLYFLIKNIIERDEIKNYIYSAILFGFSFSMMSHSLFIVLFIYLVYLLFYIREKKIFYYLILSIFIFFIINSNWLIGNFYLNTGTTLNYVNTIDKSNIDNFNTNSLDDLGPEITALLLYGFWGEQWGNLYLPSSENSNWYIAGIVIFIIILTGFISLYQDKRYRKFALFIFTLGFISYILGVGVIAKWGFISQFLYDYMPYYVGLREPQKWLGLLTIVYAIFFIYGVYVIVSRFDRYNYVKYFSIIIVLLFLNAWSPNTLFGFNNQLIISDFPKDYFTLRSQQLNTVYTSNKYLVLPWHSYMQCDYTNKVVANVMGDFFKPLNAVIADNIEVGSLYSNSSSEESKDIDKFIINKDIILLKNHGFTNIIMLNTCADYDKYNAILQYEEKIKQIKKGFTTNKITIYKIQ